MSTCFTKCASPGHVATILLHWEALVKIDHRYYGSLELQNAKTLTWTYEPDQPLEIQRNEIQFDQDDLEWTTNIIREGSSPI